MKILVLSGVMLASTLGIVFLQAETPSLGFEKWEKLGALGLSLTALIWVAQHLLRVTVPQQQKMFTDTLDKIAERSERHDEGFRKSLHELHDNCQQTREAMKKE